MTWSTSQRLAAIDIIAFKLISEINPSKLRNGLILIRELTWITADSLNNSGILREWLNTNELENIKRY